MKRLILAAVVVAFLFTGSTPSLAAPVSQLHPGDMWDYRASKYAPDQMVQIVSVVNVAPAGSRTVNKVNIKFYATTQTAQVNPSTLIETWAAYEAQVAAEQAQRQPYDDAIKQIQPYTGLAGFAINDQTITIRLSLQDAQTLASFLPHN